MRLAAGGGVAVQELVLHVFRDVHHGVHTPQKQLVPLGREVVAHHELAAAQQRERGAIGQHGERQIVLPVDRDDVEALAAQHGDQPREGLNDVEAVPVGHQVHLEAQLGISRLVHRVLAHQELNLDPVVAQFERQVLQVFLPAAPSFAVVYQQHFHLAFALRNARLIE